FFNAGGVVSLNNTTSTGTIAAQVRDLRGTGGITFAPDGSVRAYIPGSVRFGLTQVGGDLYPTYTDANITVPVERYTGFAHADYALNDAINAFVEGSYGHIKGTLLQTAYFSASLPIYADNPFIPTEVRAVVGAAPAVPSGDRPAAATFTLGRVF